MKGIKRFDLFNIFFTAVLIASISIGVNNSLWASHTLKTATLTSNMSLFISLVFPLTIILIVANVYTFYTHIVKE